MLYVLILLASIVAANLTVAWFGPAAMPVNAFLLIGLNLSTRDRIHDLWHGRHLSIKMAGVVAVGSVLTWVLNRGAGTIAIASVVAFSGALIVDAVVYEILFDRPRLVKINGSNALSAAADSIIFPTIAFGVFLPWAILAQFAAKIAGGFVWSLVLTRAALTQRQGGEE